MKVNAKEMIFTHFREVSRLWVLADSKGNSEMAAQRRSVVLPKSVRK